MKVLVGITTRNRAELLVKAIQSVLEQDYPNIEIAVFDDASTDDTPQVSLRYPQVKWHRAEKQHGLLLARNYLMRETDATFYCSLDDDAWFIQGDEISRGVEILQHHPEVAALAYDILSPDRPQMQGRKPPYKTHIFIGCGHLLRLSAVHEVGFYAPNPGIYGSEEKDLCVRLLDHSHEVMFMPGVHVWHDKTMLARDIAAQHSSGVCNDFVFALRRCPLPMILWFLPGKFISHLRFAVRGNLLYPCLTGIIQFLKASPGLLRTRKPVTYNAFQTFLKRSRTYL